MKGEGVIIFKKNSQKIKQEKVYKLNERVFNVIYDPDEKDERN